MNFSASNHMYFIHSSSDDCNKSCDSMIAQKITKFVKSDFDLGISSNLDLTVSELELRDIHLSCYKSKSPKWESVNNKCRFPLVMHTRSMLRDELEILKINMSLHDKVIEFREAQKFKDKSRNFKNKAMKGASLILKKFKSTKIKDLITIIEGSETAKTDKVIWKFLKRNSVLRKEYLSIKKFLIEIQGSRLPDSRLQNTQPIKVTCPNCRFFIITKTERVSTTRTKILSFILTILGLCSTAFMMFTIKDTVHLCPLCQIYLGFCPALGSRRKTLKIRSFLQDRTINPNDSIHINSENFEMVSASSTSAKNLFAEPKLRLCDRVQVNVNNVAAIARQIQRGSKASENLIAAAKNFALQEAAIENSETNLKKLKLLTTHIHNQLDSLHSSSSKMESVLEQVRSMQR